MDHETAGDPLSGLKWTRRTTAKVAAELGKLVCQRSLKTDRFSTPVGDSAGTRCSFGLD